MRRSGPAASGWTSRSNGARLRPLGPYDQHTSKGGTHAPATSGPGGCWVAGIHGARVTGPGPPAPGRPWLLRPPGPPLLPTGTRGRPAPRTRTSQEAAAGTGSPKACGPHTHLTAGVAAAAAAATVHPPDQAPGDRRPAGRGAAPARALPIGRRRPRPAPRTAPPPPAAGGGAARARPTAEAVRAQLRDSTYV